MHSSCPVYTPVGTIVIVYRPAPFQLTRIRLPGETVEETGGPVYRDPVPVGKIGGRIRKASNLLAAYFQGRPIQTPWEILRTDGLTPFQKTVLCETACIPYGALKTYKNLAEAVGRPRAFRSVGTALAGNPFPILIPCHRVVRSDHTPGGFGGGIALKKWLIEHEADTSLADRRPLCYRNAHETICC